MDAKTSTTKVAPPPDTKPPNADQSPVDLWWDQHLDDQHRQSPPPHPPAPQTKSAKTTQRVDDSYCEAPRAPQEGQDS